MRIALAASTRVLIGAVTAAALLALYSGCGDQSTERRGGGDIPDLAADSGMMATAGAGGDASDAAGASGAAGAADRIRSSTASVSSVIRTRPTTARRCR
jgi:hypothetical protein